MKKLLCLLPALLCFMLVKAQFQTVGEGQIFDEPEKGYCKILQLKNGNTFFLRFTFRDGIYITPYDKNHKAGTEVHVKPLFKKLAKSAGTTHIEGIFEIAGDVVVFVSKYESTGLTLYRLIMDGNNGNLKEDKVLAVLEKVSVWDAYGSAFGEGVSQNFYVKKDPYSENYAIAEMHSYAKDRNKRLEVFHYGSDHKIISDAFYTSPNGFYKYVNYLDMAVIGNERVCVLAYGYNTKSSGGKSSELLMASLNAGAKEITATKLDFTKDMTSVDGSVKYNPITKKLVLVMAAQVNGNGGYYSCYVSSVDLAENKLEAFTEAIPTAATAKSAEIFGEKKAFYGLPQNVYINKDGSFAVVYEEIKVYSNSKGRIYTTLGNIAIGAYSNTGAELGSYLIPKSQQLENVGLSPYYLAYREGKAQKMEKGNQFKSFSYLNGINSSYILFNDIAENEERIKKGKRPVTIQNPRYCDAYLYPVKGREIMPTRQYAFGQPDKGDHNMALFAISDYDQANNIYVTLKRAKDGHHRGVQLAWLQPS
ncbi:hypothetical protein QEG73_19105 [Chitinophagaceae bacterium 26-R-25]|nr:hypothetical protein [Chitinophagaceae bacterium 26-R-25]